MDGCWNCAHQKYGTNPTQIFCANVASKRCGLPASRFAPAPCKTDHEARTAAYPGRYLIKSLLASAVPPANIIFRAVPLIVTGAVVYEFQAPIAVSLGLEPIIVKIVWVYLLLHAAMPLIFGTFYRLMDQVFFAAREQFASPQQESVDEAS